MNITNLQATVNLKLQTLPYDEEYYKKTMKVFDKANLRTDSTALSPYAFLVLLLALFNKNDFSFNEKFFMTRLNISKPTLIKALRELEAKAFHAKISDNGRTVYIFSDIKKQKNDLITEYRSHYTTILRAKYDSNTTYKRIPKSVITYGSLSINARRLLIFGNACSESQANIETFKRVLKKTSSTTIYNCIKELERQGFVTSFRKTGSNKYKYIFSWGMLEPKHASGE